MIGGNDGECIRGEQGESDHGPACDDGDLDPLPPAGKCLPGQA